jgi:hypothetical protein
MEDNVKIYKARLVAKSYRQRQIGWLWWNFLANNNVKTLKTFACYSNILWL